MARPLHPDWQFLQRDSLLVTGALLFALGLVFAGYFYYTGKMDRFSVAKRQLQGVRSNINALDEEKRLLGQYIPAYEQLNARRLIGSEPRMEWVEAVKQTAEALRLPNMRYNLSPRQPVGGKGDGTPFKLFVSTMTLELGLLHEGDLLDFLRQLEEKSLHFGLFRIDSCSLQRKGATPPTEAGVVYVQANCALSWFTLQPPNAEKSAP